jgi:hypothetical protein
MESQDTPLGRSTVLAINEHGDFYEDIVMIAHVLAVGRDLLWGSSSRFIERAGRADTGVKLIKKYYEADLRISSKISELQGASPAVTMSSTAPRRIPGSHRPFTNQAMLFHRAKTALMSPSRRE